MTFDELRATMVERQLAGRDITDQCILTVMRKTPRHLFVPESYRDYAYDDSPQPIGYEQTISQPYIVASMIQSVQLKRTDKVLEVGTGSGYQAAVLADLVNEVWTVELIPELYENAVRILRSLGHDNVHTKLGDGRLGWPKASPFEAIIVSAASTDIPSRLVEQLSEGGRMVIPLESSRHEHQDLVLVQKLGGELRKTNLYPVRFVPLTSPFHH